MKFWVKIVILGILALIALIPGIALLFCDCGAFIKVLDVINLLFEGLVGFCLYQLNWEDYFNKDNGTGRKDNI